MRLDIIKLQADRAQEAQNPMNHCARWRLGSLAGAVALLGSLVSIEAHALALGRINVQSALGEILRAEIDITEISADETASLRATIGTADVFKTAGLDYTVAAGDVRVSLQKRADGRSFLRLSSTKPVTEPFVDLVLDATWASGRVVRDYTMLFDPPNTRQSAGATAFVTPVAPMISRPIAPLAAATAPIPAPARQVPNAGLNPPAQPARKITVAPKPVAVKAATEPKPVVSGQQISVKPGDNASKIAARVKPSNVSLDQMLVALMRTNPDAFIRGNINRIKSGAVLNIPATEEVASTSSADASSMVVAQSRDFNDFRRKLAQNAPATQVASANRQATGSVQATVEDRASIATTPDKLTLSKGSVQSKAASEEKIAKDRQTNEATTRVAELSKNIGDLSKIAGSPIAASSTVASAPKAPGLATVKPAALPTPTLPAASTAVLSTNTTAAAAVPAASSVKPIAAASSTLPAASTATGYLPL